MKRIAKFEKVSYKQYCKDFKGLFNDNNYQLEEIYSSIKLPFRATKGSAGYDFSLPIDLVLKPNETITIPTGIRVKMGEGFVLNLYPRSSLGFKYQLRLNNTVGIIDSDYYYSNNEGHILTTITNGTNKNNTLELKAGERFIQGLFTKFYITYDDEVDDIRDGGFGSTNKL